jgi:hypothetical protein
MTPRELKVFATSMERACDVKIISKSQVGWVARMFRRYVLKRFSKYMPDLEESYRPCCIRLFRKTYVILNFDVGDKDVSWFYQVSTIVHECQHAFDILDYINNTGERAGNWYRNYLFDDTFRAWAEGLPNTAEAEVTYHLFGNYPEPVCDYKAYFINEAGAYRAFEGGCRTRKDAVLEQGREWTATQKAARIAIGMLKSVRSDGPK